jgi:hypothetical protein
MQESTTVASLIDSMAVDPNTSSHEHRSSTCSGASSSGSKRSPQPHGTHAGAAHADSEVLRSIEQQRRIWLELGHRATALVDLSVHTTLNVTVADLECDSISHVVFPQATCTYPESCLDRCADTSSGQVRRV